MLQGTDACAGDCVREQGDLGGLLTCEASMEGMQSEK
jgi:hypothetical protein